MKLRDLNKTYEDREWFDFENINDSQAGVSDKAEGIVNYKQKFIHMRKNAIRKKLNGYDMSQYDLGLILGQPKSYMSELIPNIVHPFKT